MCTPVGQGFCLALEDAVVLAWHLRRQGLSPQALRRCCFTSLHDLLLIRKLPPLDVQQSLQSLFMHTRVCTLCSFASTLHWLESLARVWQIISNAKKPARTAGKCCHHVCYSDNLHHVILAKLHLALSLRNPSGQVALQSVVRVLQLVPQLVK